MSIVRLVAQSSAFFVHGEVTDRYVVFYIGRALKLWIHLAHEGLLVEAIQDADVREAIEKGGVADGLCAFMDAYKAEKNFGSWSADRMKGLHATINELGQQVPALKKRVEAVGMSLCGKVREI